jgi:DNA primase
MISKSTIQEVNNRLDAVNIVNDYVRLEKKGGRWWGKCPFHGGGQERTPSFKVDPDLKTYHCFGCSKSGSIISFVMEMDKLTFPETVKSLAKKIGVEITYEEGSAGTEDDSHRNELYELYRRTTLTFEHFLHEKPEGQAALRYITGRGIGTDMIQKFKLGFAPADRDFLYRFLIQKGYSENFLEKSGLFSARYKTLPLFSGRLMFPISDRQARITAFGGRALPGTLQSDGREPPKYINSPETDIYKKSRTLYAIDLALSAIRETKTAFIAEGYMDVIALHQAGVSGAAAPLGTAFTSEQVDLLKRWADNIILVFDNDEAGRNAAYKSIILCRKAGLNCALADIEKGLKLEAGEQNYSKFKDPADILKEFGPKILKNILNYTINDFEYLILCGRSRTGGKKSAIAFLFPYLEALDSEIEREECIVQAADAFGVERDAVRNDYLKRKTEGSYARNNTGNGANASQVPIRMNGELFLLAVISANMNLYPEFRTAVEIKDIDDPEAKELFIAMEECFTHEETGIDALFSRISGERLRNFISSRGSSPEFKGIGGVNPQKLMDDGINGIKKKRCRKRLAEIGVELRKAEHDEEGSRNIDGLLAEKMFIDSQIRKLEGK